MEDKVRVKVACTSVVLSQASPVLTLVKIGETTNAAIENIDLVPKGATVRTVLPNATIEISPALSTKEKEQDPVVGQQETKRLLINPEKIVLTASLPALNHKATLTATTETVDVVQTDGHKELLLEVDLEQLQRAQENTAVEV